LAEVTLLDSAGRAGKTIGMGLLAPAPIARNLSDRIVQERLRWILQSSQPLAVIVFGSAARGKMTGRSDVDMAVIFPDEESLKVGRRSIYARPPSNPWPTDLLFYTKDAFRRRRETGGVCELIWAEGRVIHGGLE
jgi:hypothetical protein